MLRADETYTVTDAIQEFLHEKGPNACLVRGFILSRDPNLVNSRTRVLGRDNMGTQQCLCIGQ